MHANLKINMMNLTHNLKILSFNVGIGNRAAK